MKVLTDVWTNKAKRILKYFRVMLCRWFWYPLTRNWPRDTLTPLRPPESVNKEPRIFNASQFQFRVFSTRKTFALLAQVSCKDLRQICVKNGAGNVLLWNWFRTLAYKYYHNSSTMLSMFVLRRPFEFHTYVRRGCYNVAICGLCISIVCGITAPNDPSLLTIPSQPFA